MSSYSGYIVANESRLHVSARDLEMLQPEVKGAPTLSFRDTAYGVSKWKEFTLSSKVPLADEPETPQATYDYQVYVIIGYGKLILLAARRRIIDYLITQILDRKIFPNYRKVSIHVDRLIDFCTQPESEFLITSLHGRFAGANRNLKSMSLYGDDVTNSTLYEEFHDFFNFHSCGVGRRLFNGLPKLRPNEEGEIVRISNDGFINLNVSTRRHAKELIQVVNYIVKNRWVEDWVPHVNGDD